MIRLGRENGQLVVMNESIGPKLCASRLRSAMMRETETSEVNDSLAIRIINAVLEVIANSIGNFRAKY